VDHERNLFRHGPPEIAMGTVRRQLTALNDACAAINRDPGDIAKILVHTDRRNPVLASVESFRATAQTCVELGFTDLVVPFPRETEPYRAELAVLEKVAAEVLPTISREFPPKAQ
jgi:hypothetical protein